MLSRVTKEPFILLAGDLAVFAVSLWLALFVRFAEVPPTARLAFHAYPFGVVFGLWVIAYFIFDLYRKQRAAFRRKLASRILQAHIFGSLFAVLAFYFLPFLVITPRRVLFIYIAISYALVLVWRLYVMPALYRGRLERAALFASGPEFHELREEIRHNPKYRIQLVDVADPRELKAKNVKTVIVDMESDDARRHMNAFYGLVFEGVHFVDARTLYEEIFDRVPLSLLGEGWFLENISGNSKIFYDLAKRAMDIALAIPLAIVTAILLPFVALAIRLEDGGPLFVTQERIGKQGKLFTIHKFRSMSGNDSGAYGADGKSVLRVTKVGAFLRKTRIDELPQVWSVLVGEQSLVGPRPELPTLAGIYRREIPHYDVRHLIKPGLSGWAQIYHERHPHHGTAIEDTRDKLSFDLYYVKNRSFSLDLKIALKTIKTLISVVGI